MSIDHIILGILRQSRSGYEVKQYFDGMINHFWAADQSQIYRTLKRLESGGLVACTDEPPKKGPPRRVYVTTDAGRAELLAWLAREPIPSSTRVAFAAQLCFMGEMGDPAHTLRFLAQLREKQERGLATLRGLDQIFRNSNPAYPDQLPWRDYHFAMTLDMGISAVQARVSWICGAMESLERRLGEDQDV